MKNIELLPCHNLVEELKNYNPPFVLQKAMRVYRKCIDLGKFALAAKIKNKYPAMKYSHKYDIVDATGFALFAILKNPGKKE